jgi:hypothetical protein
MSFTESPAFFVLLKTEYIFDLFGFSSPPLSPSAASVKRFLSTQREEEYSKKNKKLRAITDRDI